MRKLIIICSCIFSLGLMTRIAVAQISYCKDFLESGNPGGLGTCDIIGGPCSSDLDCAGGALACLGGSLKTFEDTWTLSPGNTVDVDIWLNDVPEALIAGGVWLEYDPALVNIINVMAYDTDIGGSWDSYLTTKVSEPSGPGTFMLVCGNFSCVAPDGAGDILLAKVTFECQEVGNADITIKTIPLVATVGGCIDTIYDSQIAPNTITIYQRCIIDGDCDDDVSCTDDSCVAGMCENTPNDDNCSDDGLYCTGDEICDSVADCYSSGDPCPTNTDCNEETDECYVVDIDSDTDGIVDSQDNCPNHPNGPVLGTCTSGPKELIGIQTCIINADCDPNGFCSKNQEDIYPPGGNGIGDACECEGDFDCDGDQDGSDAAKFKEDFGRSSFSNPCPICQ